VSHRFLVRRPLEPREKALAVGAAAAVGGAVALVTWYGARLVLQRRVIDERPPSPPQPFFPR
jgi:hypothetical protein